jgi:hypothetical protein
MKTNKLKFEVNSELENVKRKSVVRQGSYLPKPNILIMNLSKESIKMEKSKSNPKGIGKPKFHDQSNFQQAMQKKPTFVSTSYQESESSLSDENEGEIDHGELEERNTEETQQEVRLNNFY